MGYYHLVVWRTNPATTSILKTHEIKKKGSQILGKWGNKWYNAKLLRTSSDENCLLQLEVDANGRLMTPAKRRSFPDAVLAEKRKNKKEKKKTSTLSRKGMKAADDHVLKTKSIFLEESSDDDSDVNKKQESSCQSMNANKADIDNEAQSSGMKRKREKPPAIRSKDQEREKNVNEAEGDEKREEDIASNDHNIDEGDEKREEDIASNDHDTDEGDEKRDEDIASDDRGERDGGIEDAESDVEKSDDDDGENSDDNNYINAYKIFKEGKIRLIKGYDIYVPESEIVYLKSNWRDKPQEHVRRLMKLIIGKKNLKEMTPTGWGKSPRIPEDVYKAVFLYVNKKVTKNSKNGKMTKIQYRRTLTNMCNTLRYTKKVKKSV